MGPIVPHVTIVGGGIAGLTLAHALHTRNCSSLVLEARSPASDQGGAALAMAPNAMWVFRQLGLADRIVAQGSRIDRYLFMTPTGRLVKSVDLSRISGRWQESSWAVPRAHILRTLTDAISQASLSWNHSIHAIIESPEGFQLRQENGRTLSATLIVGADGARSIVRRALWNLPDVQYQGFVAVRGLVPFCLPETHRHTVVQVWGGRGEFGYSPVGSNLVYWFATLPWPNPSATPPSRAAISSHFRRWVAPTTDLIEATVPTDLLVHPIFDRLQPFTPRPAATLIGDAAHLMTPNTGQGACQAIVDAYVLARELAHSPDDIPHALNEYHRIRLAPALWVGRRSRQLGRLIHCQVPGLGSLQSAVLRAVPAAVVTEAMRQVVGTPETLSLQHVSK